MLSRSVLSHAISHVWQGCTCTSNRTVPALSEYTNNFHVETWVNKHMSFVWS